MSEHVRSLLVAAYLLLAILLGGSAQGMWTNLALQILGIALIAWAAIARPADNSGSGSVVLPTLLLAALALVLLQLIPLSAEIWTRLPGRFELATGYPLLGIEPPALPLSLTPNASVMTLLAAIPAIAAFVATEKLHPAHRWVAIAVVAGTMLGIVLGALQVAGGRGSWAYLYRITNSGAVGFFANRNHMATLLLVAIPMAAALVASAKADRRSTTMARYGVGAAILALIVIGIVLNGSLAATALSLPVLIASAALLPAAGKWSRVALPVSFLILAGAVALLATRPTAVDTLGGEASASVSSRTEIWTTTGEAIADTFPAGTGLGSFEQVYRQYEDPMAVTSEYVNHAHNDYLEIVLELGAPGLLLIGAFLMWWIVAAVRIWSSLLSTPFARAATIATAAVLAHSIVDFPLRTAAIGSVFGALVAVMARHFRSAPVTKRGESRPARHVKIG